MARRCNSKSCPETETSSPRAFQYLMAVAASARHLPHVRDAPTSSRSARIASRSWWMRHSQTRVQMSSHTARPGKHSGLRCMI